MPFELVGGVTAVELDVAIVGTDDTAAIATATEGNRPKPFTAQCENTAKTRTNPLLALNRWVNETAGASKETVV